MYTIVKNYETGSRCLLFRDLHSPLSKDGASKESNHDVIYAYIVDMLDISIHLFWYVERLPILDGYCTLCVSMVHTDITKKDGDFRRRCGQYVRGCGI